MPPFETGHPERKHTTPLSKEEIAATYPEPINQSPVPCGYCGAEPGKRHAPPRNPDGA